MHASEKPWLGCRPVRRLMPEPLHPRARRQEDGEWPQRTPDWSVARDC